ncbi:MAG: hypothetical protein AAF417_12680, partial [Pseudomonadota bacterium]
MMTPRGTLLAPLLLLPMLLAILWVDDVAANEDLAGDWMLELTGSGPTIIGMLSLRQSNDGWVGHVEGGPVDVTVDGDALTVVIDSRDLQGFVFDRILTGQLSDGQIAGTFEISGATYGDEPG